MCQYAVNCGTDFRNFDSVFCILVVAVVVVVVVKHSSNADQLGAVRLELLSRLYCFCFPAVGCRPHVQSIVQKQIPVTKQNQNKLITCQRNFTTLFMWMNVFLYCRACQRRSVRRSTRWTFARSWYGCAAGLVRGWSAGAVLYEPSTCTRSLVTSADRLQSSTASWRHHMVVSSPVIVHRPRDTTTTYFCQSWFFLLFDTLL